MFLIAAAEDGTGEKVKIRVWATWELWVSDFMPTTSIEPAINAVWASECVTQSVSVSLLLTQGEVRFLSEICEAQ